MRLCGSHPARAADLHIGVGARPMPATAATTSTL